MQTLRLQVLHWMTIAANKLCAAPDDIARLGFAIAHELNASLPSVPLQMKQYSIMQKPLQQLCKGKTSGNHQWNFVL